MCLWNHAYIVKDNHIPWKSARTLWNFLLKTDLQFWNWKDCTFLVLNLEIRREFVRASRTVFIVRDFIPLYSTRIFDRALKQHYLYPQHLCLWQRIWVLGNLWDKRSQIYQCDWNQETAANTFTPMRSLIPWVQQHFVQRKWQTFFTFYRAKRRLL